MAVQNMNHYAKMNAVCYALYWLQEINKSWIEPVRIQPCGGTFAKPFEVTLTCETPDANIRYTLDSMEPTGNSHFVSPWVKMEQMQSCANLMS